MIHDADDLLRAQNGTVLYTPTSSTLNGTDFTNFLAKMHATPAVTGAPIPTPHASHAICAVPTRPSTVHTDVCFAESPGVQLSPPGTYSVIPITGQTTDHIQMNCASFRTAQFTVDLTGSTLMFTVRPALHPYRPCTSWCQ